MAGERLADVLDEADTSGAVVIERRGVQYVLTPKQARVRSLKKSPSRIQVLDPAVNTGEWTWAWTPAGARFVPRS
jgi:hypothetical protein